MAFYIGLFFWKKNITPIANKKIDTILTTWSNLLKHFPPTLFVALIYITLQSPCETKFQFLQSVGRNTTTSGVWPSLELGYLAN